MQPLIAKEIKLEQRDNAKQERIRKNVVMRKSSDFVVNEDQTLQFQNPLYLLNKEKW